MLEIKKRIPIKNKKFNNRTLDERVYCWFQHNSFSENIDNKNLTLSPRYIAELKKPWLEFYKDLEEKKSKRKFNDQLKKWIKLGFIEEYEVLDSDGYKKEYYLLPYDKEIEEFYYLIDTDVLEYLVNTKSVGVIRIYTYLMFRYAKFPNYTFTVKELAKECFNISTSSRNVSTEKIITDCLLDLEATGFFDVDHDHYISLNGKATRVKKLYNVNHKPFVINKRGQLQIDKAIKERRNLEEEFNKLSTEEQAKLLFG